MRQYPRRLGRADIGRTGDGPQVQLGAGLDQHREHRTPHTGEKAAPVDRRRRVGTLGRRPPRCGEHEDGGLVAWRRIEGHSRHNR